MDLNHGEVRSGVTGDEARLKDPLIMQSDLHACRSINHVVIGQNESAFVHDNPATRRGFDGLRFSEGRWNQSVPCHLLDTRRDQGSPLDMYVDRGGKYGRTECSEVGPDGLGEDGVYGCPQGTPKPAELYEPQSHGFSL